MCVLLLFFFLTKLTKGKTGSSIRRYSVCISRLKYNTTASRALPKCACLRPSAQENTEYSGEFLLATAKSEQLPIGCERPIGHSRGKRGLVGSSKKRHNFLNGGLT